MKIIDKYIFKSFVKLYFIILSAFVSIFLVVEFFEKFSKFLGHDAEFIQIVTYFLLRIPYIAILASPVTMLLAALFLFHYLNKHHETIAIRTAGMSILRMSLPLFAFALLISLLMLFFGNRILASAEQQREYIKDVKIYDREERKFKMRSNLQYKNDQGYLFYIGFFDGYRNKIKHIDITQFKNDKVKKKIIAKEGKWKRENNETYKLVFYNIEVRNFSNGKQTSYESYDKKTFPQINIQPIDLVKSSKDPQEEMDYFELKNYIERLKRIGENYQTELVELNVKISFPFMNLIVLLFSIPIANLTNRSHARGMEFVLAIGISFLYISILRLGQSLGYNGILSPFFSAWFANILFAILGLSLLWRTQRI